MEKIGYILLGIVETIWIIVVLVGVIAAFPIGLIGLIAIIGIGLLFVKVVKDRINNIEDDHYSENVDK